MNGWLTLALHWWGRFEYLPSDNHGPFLYYAGALFFRTLGPSDFSLRLAPALAGALLPLALLPARRWFPGGGLLIAGLLLAIAPGLVYFSRAAIHEIVLVLFSALWAASLARFAARPSRGWGAACGAAAAGCFVTKETALLTAASLATGVLAAGAAWLVAQASGERSARLLARLRECARAAPAGILVFAAGITLFYSSFFTLCGGAARLLRGLRVLGRVWDDGAKPDQALRMVLGADGLHARAPIAGWRSRPLRSPACAAIRRGSRWRAGRSAPS